MPLDTVTLRTGEVHSLGLVRTVHLLLRGLLDRGMAIPFYEAVTLARNPKHELWPGAADQLGGLLDDAGAMHRAVREIIVASVEGEGLDMKLLPITESIKREDAVELRKVMGADTTQAPSEGEATGCRRCHECAELSHHWMEGFAEDENGDIVNPDEPQWVCKHCDFTMPWDDRDPEVMFGEQELAPEETER